MAGASKEFKSDLKNLGTMRNLKFKLNRIRSIKSILSCLRSILENASVVWNNQTEREKRIFGENTNQKQPGK